MCEEVASPKINKTVLNKSLIMREEKSPFENKKSQIKLVITLDWNFFPERFPHPDMYSWGISFEYLSGWPEPTKEEITR